MNVQQYEEISKKVITAIHHILNNNSIIKRFESAVNDFRDSIDVEESCFSSSTILLDQTSSNIAIQIPDYSDYMIISPMNVASALSLYCTLDGLYVRPSVVNEEIKDLMGFPLLNNKVKKVKCFNKRVLYLSWGNPASVGQMIVNIEFMKRGNSVRR